MRESDGSKKKRTTDLKDRGREALLPNWLLNLMQQKWFRVSPIFSMGTIITAAGTTIQKSDTVIFVGMVTMGLGVVAMWIAETGKPKFKSLSGPLAFIAGSVLTAASMTISPSDPLLCSGMILTGLGTTVMWIVLVGNWGIGTAFVAGLFFAGITTEAISLTVLPSDLMIMIGMIATGIGVFAMWAYETGEDTNEKEKASEEGTPIAESRN